MNQSSFFFSAKFLHSSFLFFFVAKFLHFTFWKKSLLLWQVNFTLQYSGPSEKGLKPAWASEVSFWLCLWEEAFLFGCASGKRSFCLIVPLGRGLFVSASWERLLSFPCSLGNGPPKRAFHISTCVKFYFRSRWNVCLWVGLLPGSLELLSLSWMDSRGCATDQSATLCRERTLFFWRGPLEVF